MLKIEKNEKNPLFERKEIICVSEELITPSKASVQEELAKILNQDKELIVIKKIDPQYGMQKAIIKARVYDSLEALKKFEPKKKEKKVKKEEKS